MGSRRNFVARGLVLVALGASIALPAAAGAASRNGFDLAGARVPEQEIRAGGPPRDGIESVDAPEFVSVDAAQWVAPRNPVLGVVVGEEAHVYPVHLIEPHQIVNDELAGIPVVVTYDPLTAAPRAYRSEVEGRTLHFGVSGLVYNANFLLYDRETESLWIQFNGLAISGPMAGKRLRALPIRQELLATWLARQPLSQVLVRPRPQKIDYRYSRYARYMLQDKIVFPVNARDERFHAKELVLGVVVGDRARAYLGSIVTRAGGKVEDALEGKRVRIDYRSEDATFGFEVDEGVAVTEAYWFAWKAFHPETEIWNEPGQASGAE